LVITDQHDGSFDANLLSAAIIPALLGAQVGDGDHGSDTV